MDYKATIAGHLQTAPEEIPLRHLQTTLSANGRRRLTLDQTESFNALMHSCQTIANRVDKTYE